MSNRDMVSLHHIIAVSNDMFHYMDGIMQDIAKKWTPWKDDWLFGVKFVQQKLTKEYVEVPAMTEMLLISVHVLSHVRKLRSFIL